MKKFLCILLTVVLCNVWMIAFAEENEPDVSQLGVGQGILVGAAYGCSGDEVGNVFYASIGWTEDATLVLEVAESPAYDMVVTMNRYSAADDTLARIAALVNEFDMIPWAERPDYFEVCDAAHPYLYLTVITENDERIEYAISGYVDFSEDEDIVFQAVKDIVLES